MRDAHDDLRPLRAQRGHCGGRGPGEVGADHDRGRPLEGVERRRQAEEPHLHAARLLDDRRPHPRTELGIAADVDVAGDHGDGALACRPREVEDTGEELGAVLELVVAWDDDVQAEPLQQPELGHAEVLVEEQVAIHQVAAVDEDRVRVGRLLGPDDGGRLGDSAQRAVEAGVLRAPRRQVRMSVVDVQQRHLLRGRADPRRRQGEQRDQDAERFHRTRHGVSFRGAEKEGAGKVTR